MSEATEGVSNRESPGAGRVLVFSSDDASFALQLDWVQAVYARDSVAIHTAKARGGRSQPFLLHAGEPALVVDLREAFGLSGLLGDKARSAFLVVRSGSFLVALQVDAVLGVRDLDLHGQTAVPSALIRDAGLCVGHLVEQDGGVLAVLDPNCLVDSGLREILEPVNREARAFVDRQVKVDALWREICNAPSSGALRTYSRLLKRVGRSKAAAASRTVLKFLEALEGAGSPAADSFSEKVVRDLVRAAEDKKTGQYTFGQADGGGDGRIFLESGRIVDAYFQSDWGRRALKRILELRDAGYSFSAEAAAGRPVRITESTVASLVSALESISEERRGRRER